MLEFHVGELTLNRARGDLEAGIRVQPHDPLEIREAESVDKLDVPAEWGGREGERRNGVTHVMVAVAEGALTVLPGLAPEDGGDADQK